MAIKHDVTKSLMSAKEQSEGVAGTEMCGCAHRKERRKKLPDGGPPFYACDNWHCVILLLFASQSREGKKHK